MPPTSNTSFSPIKSRRIENPNRMKKKVRMRKEDSAV
jgi:hypothetical protein